MAQDAAVARVWPLAQDLIQAKGVAKTNKQTKPNFFLTWLPEYSFSLCPDLVSLLLCWFCLISLTSKCYTCSWAKSLIFFSILHSFPRITLSSITALPMLITPKFQPRPLWTLTHPSIFFLDLWFAVKDTSNLTSKTKPLLFSPSQVFSQSSYLHKGQLHPSRCSGQKSWNNPWFLLHLTCKSISIYCCLCINLMFMPSLPLLSSSNQPHLCLHEFNNLTNPCFPIPRLFSIQQRLECIVFFCLFLFFWLHPESCRSSRARDRACTTAATWVTTGTTLDL